MELRGGLTGGAEYGDIPVIYSALDCIGCVSKTGSALWNMEDAPCESGVVAHADAVFGTESVQRC